MKMTRDNFRELLTPIHRGIIKDEYAQIPEQYPKVFHIIDMTKFEETWPHLGAFGLWEQNTEGNTINEDEISIGPVARLEARRFDKGYSVTWELARDNLYGPMGVFNGGGINGSARGLARGLRATIETDTANILNNGFTNTGYDGVPLFSNSHPLVDSGLLGQNLATGPLTPDNLSLALTMMRNQVNEAGIKTQNRATQLIVGPDLEYIAKELVSSSNRAFELSNTNNVYDSLEVIVLDYITGPKWFLRDKTDENLVFGWRDRVKYDSYQLPKTVDWFMYGYTRWDCTYVNWRGLVGSTGLPA